MEQSRKGTTGSTNTQRTSTPTQNTKYSADASMNFKQQNPSQGQPQQHGRPGEKTGSRNPQQDHYRGKDERAGDKR